MHIVYRGHSVISKSHKYFGFMNFLDGIKIYTLPGLAHLDTIKQDVYDETNVTLGIVFVEDEYVIAGDKGAI